MKTRPLPLVLFLTGCAASDAAEPLAIENFAARSVAVQCMAVPTLTARESTVADVAMVSDTSFLVLYSQDREVALVGPELVPTHVVRFAEDGPTGVSGPVSATLVGDTLLYIADQHRQRLKLLGPDGGDRGTVHLPFPPQRVQATPAGEVLVTPFVMGRHPSRLVYRLAGTDARALEVPTVRYGDPGMNTLANLAGIAAFPDGRVVVTHEFLVPYAHELRGDGAPPVRMPVPLPDAAVARLRPPTGSTLEETSVTDLPVAVLASAPDPRTGDLLYLTRSGRSREGRPEKALVRLGPNLEYRRSYLLDVNAIRVAYLARRGLAVVVDDLDRWYTCPAA